MQFITKKRSKKVVATVVAIVLIPTAAFAAWFFLGRITGSVTTADANITLTNVRDQAPYVDAKCTATIDTGNAKLTVWDAYPGGHCDYTMTYANGGESAYQVQGVSFDDGEFVHAYVVDGCGKALEAGLSATIVIRVEVADTAPMGTTIPAGASAGVKIVPQGQYVAANCPIV